MLLLTNFSLKNSQATSLNSVRSENENTRGAKRGMTLVCEVTVELYCISVLRPYFVRQLMMV